MKIEDLSTFYEFNISSANIRKFTFSSYDNMVFIIGEDNSVIQAGFNDKIYSNQKQSTCDPIDLRNNYLYN